MKCYISAVLDLLRNLGSVVFSVLLLCLCCLPLSAEEALVEQHTQIAFDLYGIEKNKEEGNLLVAPYSVITGLSMLYMGARGETAGEIAEVLHMQESAQDLQTGFSKLRKNLPLTMSNALFVSQETFLLTSFREVLERSFSAEIERVDFTAPEKATEKINGWIREKTQGNIPQLLEKGKIGTFSSLIIAQGFSLKEAWKFPFRQQGTRSAVFHKTEEEEVSVSMMQGMFEVPYFENDLLQMVALPLEKSGIACLCLVPKSFANLPLMEEELRFSFAEWISKLQPRRIHLQLPRCSLRDRISFKETLEKLGMRTSFTSSANFSGIDGKLDLTLTEFVAESFLCLDEEGILVAGSSAEVLTIKGVAEQASSLQLIADKPFVLIVRDEKTGEILLMGKVTTP